ncbi:hypothetical protein [Pararhodobacter sp. CCB-MM2]|uniref:hypothetical protein n=1 Tax=Pararhodobacter sp. CCB-MM2 TaxID=1786003 RepID=UPI00082ECD1B|nr:hypothetical protein [Pararhodobacter sp. CCB-MM2]
MSRIDAKARALIKRAVYQAKYEHEALAVDFTAAGLVADGEGDAEAKRAAQKAWDDVFKVWGAA